MANAAPLQRLIEFNLIEPDLIQPNQTASVSVRYFGVYISQFQH